MPTAERYARYREDQTTIWVSKTAADFLSRERGSPGEGAAAVLDRVHQRVPEDAPRERRGRRRRGRHVGRPGAATGSSAARRAREGREQGRGEGREQGRRVEVGREGRRHARHPRRARRANGARRAPRSRDAGAYRRPVGTRPPAAGLRVPAAGPGVTAVAARRTPRHRRAPVPSTSTPPRGAPSPTGLRPPSRAPPPNAEPTRSPAARSATRSRRLADGARDLRELLWSSIDNDESRDLDQVEWAEARRPDGAIRVLVGDRRRRRARAARLRGRRRRRARNATSVYTGVARLPDAARRALRRPHVAARGRGPPRDRRRAASSAPTARSTRHDVYRALVRNHAKLVYEDVGAWLEGGRAPGRASRAMPGLEAQLRLQRRGRAAPQGRAAARRRARVRDDRGAPRHARTARSSTSRSCARASRAT